MISLPAIKQKQKNKLKKSEHNKNKKTQKSTEKIDKVVKTHQKIPIIDSQHEALVSLRAKKREIFDVLFEKVKTPTLKSKTCLKNNKKKIEDALIQNKPRIVNKILLIAKSFKQKISNSQFFSNNSVFKPENDMKSIRPQSDTGSKGIDIEKSLREYFHDISSIETASESPIFSYKPNKIKLNTPMSQPLLQQKQNSHSHITSESIFHECNKTIKDYEVEFDISSIQYDSESPNFSYKPKTIISNKKNKFVPSTQIQKLMLLDVKPSARLEKSIKENSHPSNSYQNISPKQNTLSLNKNYTARKSQANTPQRSKCNCDQFNAANNLVMLKWVSHEQNLGTYDAANFTAIASQIFSSYEIENYLRRNKNVEDSFYLRQ
jgi:hypothetical protein